MYKVKNYITGILIISLFMFLCQANVYAEGIDSLTDPLPLIIEGQAVEDDETKENVSTKAYEKIILNLEYNGEIKNLSKPLHLSENLRTMISLDAISEVFNCSVGFVEPDRVIVSTDYKDISFYLNEVTYYVNGSSKTMDEVPLIEDDFTIYIPLRFVAEELEYYITYNPNTRTVKLKDYEYNQIIEEKMRQAELERERLASLSPPANLPTWGNLSDYPELGVHWQNEQVVGGYYTKLVNSPAGRTNNIKLSSQKINSTVLRPTEVFSFNNVVGPRTVARGFQYGGVIVGNEIVPGIGGGICQTSSTLYNTALSAGMQIVERFPHSLPVAYVAPGRDATVLWNSADFKFRNNKDFDVKILAKVWEQYVIMSIVKTP